MAPRLARLGVPHHHANRHSAHTLEHFHDAGLVRPPALQGRAFGATIVVSWLIALPEYSLQVPANRWGSAQFTTAQLKIIQEVISIGVFVIFNMFYFGIMPNWRTGLAFALIVAAVVLVVRENP